MVSHYEKTRLTNIARDVEAQLNYLHLCVPPVSDLLVQDVGQKIMEIRVRIEFMQNTMNMMVSTVEELEIQNDPA